MRVLGLVFSFGIVIAVCQLNNQLALFFDFYSFLVVVGCAHGALLAIYGLDAFRILLPNFTPKNSDLAVRIAAAGSHLYIVAGWLGTLIGWIKISSGIDPNKMETFGPAFAVSLLTLLYGYLLHFFLWFPLKSKWANRNKEKQSLGAL